jgi:hypothetical protein
MVRRDHEFETAAFGFEKTWDCFFVRRDYTQGSSAGLGGSDFPAGGVEAPVQNEKSPQDFFH